MGKLRRDCLNSSKNGSRIYNFLELPIWMSWDHVTTLIILIQIIIQITINASSLKH